MALERHGLDAGGAAPDKPHLAVLKDKDANEVIAMPVGSLMFIITNPNEKDGVLPLVLLSVSPKRILFGCACRSPTCNVRYEFRASRSGNHVNGKR